MLSKKTNKIQHVRGMKDLYGHEYRQYKMLVDCAVLAGESHGFSVMNTPIIEHRDVFVKSVGETSDIVSKEIYEFTDKGGDLLCLRPEGTAAVMRAIVSEGLTQSMPLKLMYYGEMFRYDRPQRGRYRQFRQFGFEHIGDKSPYNDATLISIVMNLLESLGVSGLSLCINSIGGQESRARYASEIRKILEPKISFLSHDSRIRLDKNPLRILDSKDKCDQELCASIPPITDYLSDQEREYFANVCSCLDTININYSIDTSLVRGLDYYTDTTFEIKVDNLAVCGGGRYDNLLSEFGGPSVSGVGCAIGIERLFGLISVPETLRKIVVVIPVSDHDIMYAYNVFHSITGTRKEFIHIGDMKKKMQKANKLCADIAVIIGETERQSSTLCVKNMKDGSQEIVDSIGLMNIIDRS